MEELKAEDGYGYDDTVPKEVYTLATPDQQSHNRDSASASALQSNPTGDDEIVIPRPLVAPKPPTLNKQIHDRLKITDSPVAQEAIHKPTTPGFYYFDGEKFTEHRPPDSTVYVAGSDYVRVLKAKDTDEDTGGSSDSDSDGHGSDSSEKSQEDVKIGSRLSGLKTLNINIRLNVADLVHKSMSGHRMRLKTRRKRAQRTRRSNYEIPEPFVGAQDSGKEPVENSVKSSVEEEPPPRPPRPPKPAQTVTDGAVGNNEGEETEEVIYEPVDSLPSESHTQVSTRGKLRRYNSEPVSLTAESYYSQIGDSEYTVYAQDVQMQNEVKTLLETYDWAYIYSGRQQAEEALGDTEKPNGSFAIIYENIEQNYHFPFTLLLKCDGKLTNTPIKRVRESRRKKWSYELLNTKKDTIERLVDHFRRKPLPDFKLKLI